MEPRVKILLTVLIGVLAVYVGLPIIESTILSPITNRQTDIERLDGSVEKYDGEIAQLLAASRQVKDWKAASLPSNPLAAMRLYQEWVTDLAHLCEMTGIDVRPGQKVNKRGVYTAVQVTLKSDATYDQVVRFLYHFDRVNLKQRVVAVDLTSEDNQGNPLLEVSMTLEGLSLEGASNRNYLFPIANLKSAIGDDDEQLEFDATDGFPADGSFEIRIGTEFMNVTGAESGTWTVERSAHNTKSNRHAANSEVHLTPVREGWAEQSFAKFQSSIVDRSPFALPEPPVDYEPRLRTLTDKRVKPGGEVSFQASMTGYDPALGSPQYRLKGAPEGMTIDAKSGKFEWTAAEDQAAGDIDITIEAFQPEREPDVFSTDVTIKVESPNQAPVLKLAETLPVYFGNVASFTAVAEDPDEDSTFTFSLGEGAPEGAVIDPATGAFEWTPPDDAEEGAVEVTVKVTDNGQPALSAESTIQIQLMDDVVQYTKLVMCFSEGNDRMAWLLNQYDNQRMELREGDTFTLGDVSATVVGIGKDFVMLQNKSTTWELDLGDSLRQLRKLDFLSEDPPATTGTGQTPPSDKNGKPSDVVSPEESKNSESESTPPSEPDSPSSDDAAAADDEEDVAPAKK